MTEKVAINDVLSCTNSMITLLTYWIFTSDL